VGGDFRTHCAIERGQVGILARQQIRLVQHRLEAIDDVIGLRRGRPQPRESDLVDFPNGRLCTDAGLSLPL
jgi:hypothetical protein